MIITLLGAPGSGKGTVSRLLVDEYGYKHISTGEIFKQIINSNSDLGKKLKILLASGKLVDDETTGKVLIEGFKNYDLSVDNIILDGYPRTIKQAKFLTNYLEENNYKMGKVIELKVRKKELVNRLTKRLTCPECGRSYNEKSQAPKTSGICDFDQNTLIKRDDDNEAKIEVRFDVFCKQTKPVIKYYKKQKNFFSIKATIDPAKLAKLIKEINESS